VARGSRSPKVQALFDVVEGSLAYGPLPPSIELNNDIVDDDGQLARVNKARHRMTLSRRILAA